MFSTCFDNFRPFSSNLKLSSPNSLILKSLKFVVWERVKSLPNNILDLSKLKVLADDKRNTNQNINLVLIRKKTAWEKEKMLVTKLKALAHEKRNATRKNKFAFKRLATSH